MAGKFKQGFYPLRNPEKYVGDPSKIVFRSSWELEMNKFFDNNPNILQWSSEEIAIPYIKPTTGRVHRYFPDYWIKYRNGEGEILQEIIEVKPHVQVHINSKCRITDYDRLMYAINVAKWEAATQFCKKNNIKFRILTEKEMFRQ